VEDFLSNRVSVPNPSTRNFGKEDTIFLRGCVAVGGGRGAACPEPEGGTISQRDNFQGDSENGKSKGKLIWAENVGFLREPASKTEASPIKKGKKRQHD